MNLIPKALPGTDKAGLQILVVEDNGDAAETLAASLRLHGHTVRIATDGPAGLAEAHRQAPDVVLLDIGLPEMDGYELAHCLMRLRHRRRPLLVAVTGYGQEADKQHSARAGIHIHLVKPVDPEKLLQILDRFQESLAGDEPVN